MMSKHLNQESYSFKHVMSIKTVTTAASMSNANGKPLIENSLFQIILANV